MTITLMQISVGKYLIAYNPNPLRFCFLTRCVYAVHTIAMNRAR